MNCEINIEIVFRNDEMKCVKWHRRVRTNIFAVLGGTSCRTI